MKAGGFIERGNSQCLADAKLFVARSPEHRHNRGEEQHGRDEIVQSDRRVIEWKGPPRGETFSCDHQPHCPEKPAFETREPGERMEAEVHTETYTPPNAFASGAAIYFFVRTARRRCGNTARHISHIVPSQPRAVQCSRP